MNRYVTKCREKKTVPAYNALPMFVDRVWFVNENVILFQISKQYYINEKLNNTMTKESLSRLLSALIFVLWLKCKTQKLHQLFKI